jgi:uncharacterized protein involved in response to NO
MLSGSLQRSGLIVAGSLFAAAFGLYVFVYFPILTRPSVR